jgi:hypothetical protein
MDERLRCAVNSLYSSPYRYLSNETASSQRMCTGLWVARATRTLAHGLTLTLLFLFVHRSEQHKADAWLQEFRNAGDSWRLCLNLLASPSAQDPEAYFAANSLRHSCSKLPELLSEDVAGQLLPQLASSLLASVQANKWWGSQSGASLRCVAIMLNPTMPCSELPVYAGLSLHS